VLTGWENEPWELRWPDRTTGPYLVKLTAGIVDGRPAIIAIEMSGGTLPQPGEVSEEAFDLRPITSTDLRLPLAQLLSEHLGDLRTMIATADLSPWGSPWKSEGLADTRSALVEPTKRAGGRPRQYEDEHFEGVALIYRNALRDNLSPLAEIIRIKGVSKNKAAKWAQRARGLGYLPPTSRGRSRA
jgi:hypothetical protein